MHPDTVDYVRAYIRRLDRIGAAEDVYGRLADWQWRTAGRLESVLADFNRHCGFEADDMARFRPGLPTTATGPLDGLLVVAANPGWSEAAHAVEEASRRRSPAANRRFREHFFDHAPGSVVGTRWWMKALTLAHAVHRPDAAATPSAADLWTWGRDARALGAVDLIPFASRRDRFSRHFVGRRAPLPAHWALLRDTALATLRAVLRLQPSPRLVLVASAAGHGLVEGHRDDLGLDPDETAGFERDAPPFDRLRLHRHRRSGTRLLSFPGQVFSNSWWPPAGFSLAGLALRIRRVPAPDAALA